MYIGSDRISLRPIIVARVASIKFVAGITNRSREGNDPKSPSWRGEGEALGCKSLECFCVFLNG